MTQKNTLEKIFFVFIIISLFFTTGCCSAYRLGSKLAREESACTQYECHDMNKSICMELNNDKAWLKIESEGRDAKPSQDPDNAFAPCRPYCDHWKKASPDNESATFTADILLFPFAPLSLFSYPAGYLFTKWNL